jgi:hypothetical protein
MPAREVFLTLLIRLAARKTANDCIGDSTGDRALHVAVTGFIACRTVPYPTTVIDSYILFIRSESGNAKSMQSDLTAPQNQHEDFSNLPLIAGRSPASRGSRGLAIRPRRHHDYTHSQDKTAGADGTDGMQVLHSDTGGRWE